MKQKIQLSIRIEAPPGRIWQVLNDHAKINTQLWGQGAQKELAQPENKKYLLKNKGLPTLVIEDADSRQAPPFYLEHSLFPRGWDDDHRDEKPLTTSFQIAPFGEYSELIISQGDFKGLPMGDQRYEKAKEIWANLLPQIKKLAEQS